MTIITFDIFSFSRDSLRPIKKPGHAALLYLLLSSCSPLWCISCIVERDLKWWFSMCSFCFRNLIMSYTERFFAVYVILRATDSVLLATSLFFPTAPHVLREREPRAAVFQRQTEVLWDRCEAADTRQQTQTSCFTCRRGWPEKNERGGRLAFVSISARPLIL